MGRFRKSSSFSVKRSLRTETKREKCNVDESFRKCKTTEDVKSTKIYQRIKISDPEQDLPSLFLSVPTLCLHGVEGRLCGRTSFPVNDESRF